MLVPHARIRSALRKLWSWSPQRKEALKRAKGSLGFYLCEMCRCPIQGKPEVNHRVPIGSTPGARGSTASATWDALIARMFCPADGLEVLCAPCHRNLTNAQRKGGAA